MTDSKPATSQCLTGRAQPPTWFRLLGALFLTAAAAGLTAKRGAAVGLVAAVVYGSIAMATLLTWRKYLVNP